MRPIRLAAASIAIALLAAAIAGGKDPPAADGVGATAEASGRKAGWPLTGLQLVRHRGERSYRAGVAGRSARGRPVGILEHGEGDAASVLVFGCVHGDECGASRVRPLLGCPLYNAHVVTVPNLNPDGLALATRLNGRGVDLNRNFPSGWRRIGLPGSPQYSGPRPFSEPESRLAARIIRAVEPEVTIWFHQHHANRPLVRAWGPSIGAGHRFADLANLPFEPIPWPAGTAPNWQNHAFPGTASFVVEFPRGSIAPRVRDRLGYAIAQLAREVGED